MEFTNHSLKQLQQRNLWYSQKQLLQDMKLFKKSIKTCWLNRFQISWKLYNYIINETHVITILYKPCTLSESLKKKYRQNRRIYWWVPIQPTKEKRKQILKKINL